MWTKLEGAVSAECNEIVASKKFKERVQKPKETINLTRIQAASIGKAHETTNQEVQECCIKPPVSDSTNTVFKGKPNKGLMCNYCANKKGSHSLQTRDTALPGEQCVAFARLKIILKIPRNVSDSKKRENQNQEIQSNQDQLRNHLS